MTLTETITAAMPHMINSARIVLMINRAISPNRSHEALADEIVRNALHNLTTPLETLIADLEREYVQDYELCMIALDNAGIPRTHDEQDHMPMLERIRKLATEGGLAQMVKIAELQARVAQLESDNEQQAATICDLEAEMDNHDDHHSDWSGA